MRAGAAVALLVLCRGVAASGYHPEFDRALEEAETIVIGTVTEAWSPERPDNAGFYGLKGRVFRLTVKKAYKGTVRAGETVVFWDRHHSSTAGYHVDDPYVTSPAIRRLREHGEVFDGETLVHLLTSGGRYQRDDLLHMVTEKNIDLCRGILFRCLMEKDPDPELETMTVLATLCPEYFKRRLRTHDMPFWKLIPCLQKLGLNGSAVGKKDYSRSVLELHPHFIERVGAVVRGELFDGVSAMEDPEQHETWAEGFPLLIPILSRPDCPTRRLVVALFRSFGVPVRRDGSKCVADLTAAREVPPIRLRVELTERAYSLGNPVTISLVETATAGKGWLCFEGKLGWSVIAKDDWTGSVRSNEIEIRVVER